LFFTFLAPPAVEEPQAANHDHGKIKIDKDQRRKFDTNHGQGDRLILPPFRERGGASTRGSCSYSSSSSSSNSVARTDAVCVAGFGHWGMCKPLRRGVAFGVRPVGVCPTEKLSPRHFVCHSRDAPRTVPRRSRLHVSWPSTRSREPRLRTRFGRNMPCSQETVPGQAS